MTQSNLSHLGVPPGAACYQSGTPTSADFFLREPVRDVARWSETGFFQAYNPDENVAVFTHVCRCQQDLDLWSSHTLVFLPDGEILADRSFGRTPDDRGGVGAGASRIIIEEPFRLWRSVFDGHGERTSMAGLARGIRGAGPGVAMRYEVMGIAAGPVWDLAANNEGAPPAGNWAGHGHYQQNFLTSGTLNVAGKSYSLNGVGWNDHSRGPRTFDHYGTHRWLSALLPGATLHAITLWDSEGVCRTAAGTLFTREGREQVTIDFPGIGDTLGGPREYEIVVTRKSGDAFILKAETLHPQVLSITGANDNLNGIYWEGDVNTTVHFDSTVRLTTPSGEIGYGYAERGIRLTRLRERFPHD